MHSADEIVHKNINEPVAFLLKGSQSDPPRVDSGCGVGGSGLGIGIVSGVGAKTALEARGDHGGDKLSRSTNPNLKNWHGANLFSRRSNFKLAIMHNNEKKLQAARTA